MNRVEITFAGKITTSIILFLTTLSFIYKAFNLNFTTFNSIIVIIDDASIFMTIICVLFGAYTFISSQRDKLLMLLCIVNVIVVNHLYSNIQIMSIYIWIKKIDKRLLIFYGIIIITIFFSAYRILTKRKKNALQETLSRNEIETDEGASRNVETMISSVGIATEEFIGTEEKTEDRNSPMNIENIIIILLAIVSLLGLLEYIFYNHFQLNLKLPAIFADKQDYLYCASFVCFTFLLVYFVFKIIRKGNHPIVNSLKGLSHFSITAISAIILEFLSIFLIVRGKVNGQDIINYFLSAISDNLFSAIIAFIVTFLILQIFCTIIIHFLMPSKEEEEKDRIIEIIKEKIKGIEEKLVKISCDIIIGCLDLIDFLPDFFTTIGILLLNKENDKAKKEDNEDTL